MNPGVSPRPKDDKLFLPNVYNLSKTMIQVFLKFNISVNNLSGIRNILI